MCRLIKIRHASQSSRPSMFASCVNGEWCCSSPGEERVCAQVLEGEQVPWGGAMGPPRAPTQAPRGQGGELGESDGSGGAGRVGGGVPGLGVRTRGPWLRAPGGGLPQ